MKRKAVTRKTATAVMERPRLGRLPMEQMVSFADMLRMTDPKIKRIIKFPHHWFPAVYDRKDQAALTDIERERFLCAYQTLIGNGTLGQFVKIHGEIHYHHGSQRFLPWHRVYLLLLEQQLKSVHPDVSIPYWDWTKATEQGFPAWLASVTPTVPMPAPMSPITVTRFPSTSADLATITSSAPAVMALGDFATFTGSLEGIHNGVHVWVGGTMSMIPTAPADPIFWMHHANIDRLWAQWQTAHPGLNPNLPGPPSSSTSPVMDPWSYVESDTRSITALGYEYV
jgi:tyrosinase